MATSRQRFAAMPDAAALQRQAARTIARCRDLAAVSDVPGETTRTFLSPAMRLTMNKVQAWMEAAGCEVTTDAAGNLRGIYGSSSESAPPRRLLIGSHLDTVPNAGAFDGVLGVMIGLSLLELLNGARLSFAIELIAFSEEEGVRFRVPFLGSRALVGRMDDALLATQDADGVRVEEAIRGFGLDASCIQHAALDEGARGYLEFHIEQGPVLESEDGSLAVVEAIAGQTRGEMVFHGAANHAGTTPMHLRRDAVAAMAEWVLAVEQTAQATDGLVATVGNVSALPGAGNVVAGEARASLDVRHADDTTRRTAVQSLLDTANRIALRRSLRAEWHLRMEQEAVMMDAVMTRMAEDAVRDTGMTPRRMVSGAGHDAMILAEKIPATMIFLRSPGGLSHHPEETVREEDVQAALTAGLYFMDRFNAIEESHA